MGRLLDQLQTAATGGSAPDVFWTTLAYFDYYADGGALLPLDDQIEEDGLDMSNYNPAMTEAYTFEALSTPCRRTSTRSRSATTRRSSSRPASTTRRLDWTWDDLMAAAHELDRPGQGRVRHRRARGRRDHADTTHDPAGGGGQILSADGKKSGPRLAGGDPRVAVLGGPDQRRTRVAPPAADDGHRLAEQMFTSGKVAMYYGGSWDPVLDMKSDPGSEAVRRRGPDA